MGVVIYDQLRVSDDGQKLFINAHVSRASEFENVKIKRVTVCTEDQISEMNPYDYGGDYIYRKDKSETHTVLRAEYDKPQVYSCDDFLALQPKNSKGWQIEYTPNENAKDYYLSMIFSGKYSMLNTGYAPKLVVATTVFNPEDADFNSSGIWFAIDGTSFQDPHGVHKDIWQFKGKGWVGKHETEPDDSEGEGEPIVPPSNDEPIIVPGGETQDDTENPVIGEDEPEVENPSVLCFYLYKQTGPDVYQLVNFGEKAVEEEDIENTEDPIEPIEPVEPTEPVEPEEPEEEESIDADEGTDDKNFLHFIYNLWYTVEEEDEGKEVNLVLDKRVFNEAFINTDGGAPIDATKPYATAGFMGSDLSSNMFFVYIECDIPNVLDNLSCVFRQPSLGVTFDYDAIYQPGMQYTRELYDKCHIPSEFIDYILNVDALKLAIETEHFIPAISYWKMLKGRSCHSSPNSKKGRCGCHG